MGIGIKNTYYFVLLICAGISIKSEFHDFLHNNQIFYGIFMVLITPLAPLELSLNAPHIQVRGLNQLINHTISSKHYKNNQYILRNIKTSLDILVT